IVLFFLALMMWPTRSSSLFPYTTLFRSWRVLCSFQAMNLTPTEELMTARWGSSGCRKTLKPSAATRLMSLSLANPPAPPPHCGRSEEHTSELQSCFDLVCRLLLEKKKYT